MVNDPGALSGEEDEELDALLRRSDQAMQARLSGLVDTEAGLGQVEREAQIRAVRPLHLASDPGDSPLAVAQFADPARSRAVLIGVSHYDSADLVGLPAVRNNVRDLKDALTGSAHPLCTEANCVVAEDPRNPASVGRLLLDACAAAEDVLLFYYAGHAFPSRWEHELYLALAGTEQDNAMYTALPYRLVREALATRRARMLVVILDCLYEARALGPMAGGELADQVAIPGAYVLTAGSAYSLEHPLEDIGHTLFTGELLRVLRGGIPGGPASLTPADIYQQVREVMDRQGLPLPQQAVHQTDKLLALAPNLAVSGR